jgi:prophage regulatory protein
MKQSIVDQHTTHRNTPSFYGDTPHACFDMPDTKTMPLVILRLPQLIKLLSVSRSSIYGKMNPNTIQFDPDFPKPIRLGISTTGRGSVGWLEHEVVEYIKLCTARSRGIPLGKVL